MNMHKSEHHAIFYPQDAKELEQACAKREAEEHLFKLPGAILVPHAAYDWSLDLLHKGFAGAGALQPKQIVLLGSLHQEQLQGDKPCFLFVPSQEGISLPTGQVLFPTSLRDNLVKQYPHALAIQDSYFTEEPCIELTYPLLHSYFPSVPVLPFLMGNLDSKQVKILSTILSKIAEENGQTLFVVSTNMNAILPSAIATEQARLLATVLEEGSPLLESQRQHRISPCGLSSLEALRTQTWGSPNWNFLAFQYKDQQFNKLPETLEETDKVVWHCTALRGEA
jgi:AmmeMemoRadiSam system protein B